ncbi:concanavalin A-like lectin/glucanase domain-containing protein [Elsinoe ampelina]|uniref:Concanavalin A-like lectin/glucanase domain-containing protein n=1 Tax=Elsinoe ampelina TaxID=302913 RepID=A0A6A6GG54_9PEZI|nr:concanavalin A-like lectin/glucanase domain-containing protein [Elsinoe ampelina]
MVHFSSFICTTVAVLAGSSVALPSSHVSRQVTQGPANFCGRPNDSLVIRGTPWIVFSMNYNYQQITGSACTGYKGVTGSGADQKIQWNSTWDIKADKPNLVKGYSFIGLTQNLRNRLSAIASIPSTYHWIRTNQTLYKGNVVYDFMTSDTQGDETSSQAQELMLWLRYEGGQVPIGWSEGPRATVSLYGKDGWELYQGKNADTGITVSSLLAPRDNQYWGYFEGDIKEWLLAMSRQGIFSEETYVNVGNAGMEPFYGTVDFQADLGLRINLA